MNIQENNKEQFKIPDDYFSSLEDNVLGTYHRRQRVRRMKIITSVVCVVLLFSGVSSYFIFNNEANEYIVNSANMLKDSLPITDLQTAQTIFANEETEKIEYTSNTNNETSITTQKAQSLANTNVINKQNKEEAQNKEIIYTDSELDYLENYLDEDDYELIANSIY